MSSKLTQKQIDAAFVMVSDTSGRAPKVARNPAVAAEAMKKKRGPPTEPCRVCNGRGRVVARCKKPVPRNPNVEFSSPPECALGVGHDGRCR